MTTILFAVFLLVLFLYARMEAKHDAWLIMNGKSIDHDPSFVNRLLLCALVWLAASVVFIGLKGEFTLKPLLWIPSGWALWTMGFRWKLNKARALDWRYVSPSNWYDFAFMVTCGDTLPHKQWTWKNWRNCCIATHSTGYDLNHNYTKHVHRAGTIAYCFELTVFLLFTTLSLTAWN